MNKPVPKPALIASVIAECFDEEAPKIVFLRDTLEQSRLIEAADMPQTGRCPT